MKRYIIFAAAFLLLFSPVAFAFEWSPQVYDMPRTVLDTQTAATALSGLKTSIGSIANIGFTILGILISVSLISVLFNRLFIQNVDNLKNSGFGGVDISRNLDSDSFTRSFISGSKIKVRSNSADSDIDKSLFTRQSSYQNNK